MKIHEDVRTLALASPLAGLEDMKAKINGLPQYFEDRLSLVSKNLVDNFAMLQKVMDQRLDALPKLPGMLRGNVDPTDAQEDSVASRKANQLMAAMQRQQAGPFVQELKGMLVEAGLDDWVVQIDDHPKIVDFLLRKLQANPQYKARVSQMMARGKGSMSGSGNGGFNV